MGVDLGVDFGVYIVVEIDLSVRIIWVAKNENYTSTDILRIIMQ